MTMTGADTLTLDELRLALAPAIHSRVEVKAQ